MHIPAQIPVRRVEAAKPGHIGGMARLSLGHRALVTATRGLDALAPDLTDRIMLRLFVRPRRKRGADYRSHLPSGAQRLNLVHGGRLLTGWSWGQTGPSVLLVHGWEDHTGSMLPFVPPLRAMGYRVFTLDYPGHGLSPRGATHLLDCSHALEAMVNTHGPFDSIVGHSFGATAISIMLARTPYLRPARLVLLSPMRDMEQHLEVFADIAKLSSLRTNRLRELVASAIGRAPSTLNAIDGLQQLDIPGLVVHDRHDTVIPHEVGASLARHWRSATLISTERLGHRRVLRCPEVLSEVLRLHQASV